jgi:hypothetical protein
MRLPKPHSAFVATRRACLRRSTATPASTGLDPPRPALRARRRASPEGNPRPTLLPHRPAPVRRVRVSSCPLRRGRVSRGCWPVIAQAA